MCTQNLSYDSSFIEFDSRSSTKVRKQEIINQYHTSVQYFKWKHTLHNDRRVIANFENFQIFPVFSNG